MKKQNIVAAVGILALAANLIVPGLAFGQNQSPQQAQVDVNCGGGVLEFLETPANMTFDAVTSSPSAAQETYDALTDDDAALPGHFDPASNLMEVQDTRSEGVEGCPEATPGFTVTAEITTTLHDGALTVPENAFRVITSNEVGFNDCAIGNGEDVCYGAADGPGNARDVVAPVLYDDVGRLTASVFDKFNTRPAYTNAAQAGDTEDNPTGAGFSNTLDAPVTILTTATGHNENFQTGVALHGYIPAGQSPGLFAGELTYTLAAL